MRNIKLFIAIISLGLIVGFDACKGKGEDPVPESKRVQELLASGMWKLGSLTIDGVSKNSYPGLTITFGAGNYTSANGVPVWPTSGTWQFTDENATAFQRDDHTVVTIDALDDKNLTLTVIWTQTTLGPGRTSSVAGKHVFVMTK